MGKWQDIVRIHGIASCIRWQVEQDNHGAIKFYKGLGANLDIKGFFRWDIIA
jgi:ribosomal protein S18 acetylase RimI-like enzyme